MSYFALVFNRSLVRWSNSSVQVGFGSIPATLVIHFDVLVTRTGLQANTVTVAIVSAATNLLVAENVWCVVGATNSSRLAVGKYFCRSGQYFVLFVKVSSNHDNL